MERATINQKKSIVLLLKTVKLALLNDQIQQQINNMWRSSNSPQMNISCWKVIMTQWQHRARCVSILGWRIHWKTIQGSRQNIQLESIYRIKETILLTLSTIHQHKIWHWLCLHLFQPTSLTKRVSHCKGKPRESRQRNSWNPISVSRNIWGN